jgi:hypothetical protein
MRLGDSTSRDKILLTFMLRAVLSGYGLNKFSEIRIRKSLPRMKSTGM